MIMGTQMLFTYLFIIQNMLPRKLSFTALPPFRSICVIEVTMVLFYLESMVGHFLEQDSKQVLNATVSKRQFMFQEGRILAINMSLVEKLPMPQCQLKTWR